MSKQLYHLRRMCESGKKIEAHFFGEKLTLGSLKNGDGQMHKKIGQAECSFPNTAAICVGATRSKRIGMKGSAQHGALKSPGLFEKLGFV